MHHHHRLFDAPHRALTAFSRTGTFITPLVTNEILGCMGIKVESTPITLSPHSPVPSGRVGVYFISCVDDGCECFLNSNKLVMLLTLTAKVLVSLTERGRVGTNT